MTNYESYCEAALYRRAMAARMEDANIFCIKKFFTEDIEVVSNRKYVTPVKMALHLRCKTSELCEALSKHKRHLANIDANLLDNYGNRNFVVSYSDKVYVQGWINFLSLDCFSDSREAKAVVEVLRKETP